MSNTTQEKEVALTSEQVAEQFIKDNGLLTEDEFLEKYRSAIQSDFKPGGEYILKFRYGIGYRADKCTLSGDLNKQSTFFTSKMLAGNLYVQNQKKEQESKSGNTTKTEPATKEK